MIEGERRVQPVLGRLMQLSIYALIIKSFELRTLNQGRIRLYALYKAFFRIDRINRCIKLAKIGQQRFAPNDL